LGRRVAIALDRTLPRIGAILARQGVPPQPQPGASGDRALALAQRARELYAGLAAPAGIAAEVSALELATIYAGEGRNAPETPLGEIFPRAQRLTLFAVTIGAAVSERIAALFDEREFALATMLDAAASEGVELAADALEAALGEEASAGPGASDAQAAGASQAGSRSVHLRYSPGYCGLHVSGQRALFAALKPEAIGIRLRPSHLMEPLKSISGVIVTGAIAIHGFADAYPFCAGCRTRACRERLARLGEDAWRS
jgi:hypothetical protein